MDVLQGLLKEGTAQQRAGQHATAAALSHMEAERLIEGLQTMRVEDVGSPKWAAMQSAVRELNMQAHINAQTNSDEFVVELFVTLDKVQVLVHNLLVIEAWKELVLPHLKKALVDNIDPMRQYMLLYQECEAANLLECLLFHSHAVEAIPEEYLLELADWCHRRLSYLLSKEGAEFGDRQAERSAMEMNAQLAQTAMQEFEHQQGQLSFAVAVQSIAVTRYLTDAMPTAPMGLLGRLVSTNDTLMALLPLIERPPWVRRRKGKLERWETAGGMAWKAVDAADRLKIGQWELQLWLAINNLVVDPKARAKSSMDEWRKDRLLGLKRHLNELLFDQVPVLKDLQRVLDEIGLGAGVDKDQYKQAGLILEQVPEIQDGLTKGRDWRLVALEQAKTHFNRSQVGVHDDIEALSKMLDMMVEMDGAGKVPKDGGGPGGGAGGGDSLPGTVRVETRRKVDTAKAASMSSSAAAHAEGGVWEPWSNYELRIDAAQPPDPVEVAGEGSKGGPAPVVHGLRYRLLAPEGGAENPLPSAGKLVFRTTLTPGKGATRVTIDHHRLLAEALIKLPDAPVRDAVSELPLIVWVTAGLLATDGVVLQLKLKRADKPVQRDVTTGYWNVYHPVGGALTVKRGLADELDKSGAQPAAAPASRITPLTSGAGQRRAGGGYGFEGGSGDGDYGGMQPKSWSPAVRAYGTDEASPANQSSAPAAAAAAPAGAPGGAGQAAAAAAGAGVPGVGGKAAAAPAGGLPGGEVAPVVIDEDDLNLPD